MTDHQSDAELHMERLVQASIDADINELLAMPEHDISLVLETRRQYARWRVWLHLSLKS